MLAKTRTACLSYVSRFDKLAAVTTYKSSRAHPDNVHSARRVFPSRPLYAMSDFHGAVEAAKAPNHSLRQQRMALLTLSFQTLGAYSLHSGSATLLLKTATGIIYSDIGTSPLYTLNGLWPTTGPVPPTEDVIGGLSAIIWALTLLPLLKYVRLSHAFCIDA